MKKAIIYALAALTAAGMVLTILFLIRGTVWQGNYNLFQTHLNKSIRLSDNNGGVKAESDQGKIKVAKKNMELVYSLISQGSFQYFIYREPKGQEKVVFTFLHDDFMKIAYNDNRRRYFVSYQLQGESGKFWLKKEFCYDRLLYAVSLEGPYGKNSTWSENVLDMH